MERKLMIAPSVGCCDLFHIEEQMKVINEKSDFLHMDIKTACMYRATVLDRIT